MMKDSLKPGLTVDFKYQVPENKTVPYLYPDFEEGQVMPKVFATGFLLGLFEFSCIKRSTLILTGQKSRRSELV